MRPRATVILAALLAILAGGMASSCAARRDAPPAYEPPALYTQALEEAGAGKVSAAKQPTPAAGLAEAREAWERALAEPSPYSVFFLPAPRLLAALAPAAGDAALARKALADGFTLETLEMLAYLRNPAVRAAESRFRSTLAAYGQVEELSDLLSQASAFTGGMGIESAALFPYPAVMALQGSLVTLEAGASREDLEIARRDAVSRARRIFWELVYNGKARDILGETLRLLSALPGAAAGRYETGAAPLSGLTDAVVRREKAREDLTSLEREAGALEARLAALLDLPPGGGHVSPAQTLPSADFPGPETLARAALSRRQEIRKARIEVERVRTVILMMEAGASFGRSFDAALSPARVARTGDARGEPALPQAPGLAAPPYAYLEETRGVLQSRKAELAAVSADTPGLVRDAWTRADRARREARLYRGAVERLARLDFEAAKKSFETGQMSLGELVDLAIKRLDAKMSALAAERDLGLSLADLSEAVGAADLSSAGG